MTYHARDVALAACQAKTSGEDGEIFPLVRGTGPFTSNHGYTLEDFQAIATGLRGADFARWIVARKEPLETLFVLCHEAGVVLLPRREPGLSLAIDRVSAPNKSKDPDAAINDAIQKLFSRYRSEFTRPLD